MLKTPPPTPSRQTSTYQPCPNTDPPPSLLSLDPYSVDVTYHIVRIKPAKAGWLSPNSSALVQIIGPVPKGNTSVCDNEEAAAEEVGFEIPCAARVTWHDRSIRLKCLYYPSVSLFTGFEEYADETVNAAGDAECVKSVSVTMQDTIFGEEGTGNKMVKDVDMRDDNGNPFMVLHVNKGLAGSARLYCKKLTDSQNSLADGVDESLGLDKGNEEMDDHMDVAGWKNQKMIL